MIDPERLARRFLRLRDSDALKDVRTMDNPYYLPGRLPREREEAVNQLTLAAIEGARAGYAHAASHPGVDPTRAAERAIRLRVALFLES